MSALIWDREAAMERVDDDLELFYEVVQVFAAELPGDLERLNQAVASNDYSRIEREAHRIKSGIGNLGGMQAHEAAHALEKAAYDKDSDISSVHAFLLESIERFNAELQRVKEQAGIA
jgi:HPt (histidine-containing phosphotransfer) domain-containing protein